MTFHFLVLHLLRRLNLTELRRILGLRRFRVVGLGLRLWGFTRLSLLGEVLGFHGLCRVRFRVQGSGREEDSSGLLVCHVGFTDT